MPQANPSEERGSRAGRGRVVWIEDWVCVEWKHPRHSEAQKHQPLHSSRRAGWVVEVKLEGSKEKQWHSDSEVDQKDPARCLGPGRH
jgi:hypothetical protein